jgi:hypothetical protein
VPALVNDNHTGCAAFVNDRSTHVAYRNDPSQTITIQRTARFGYATPLEIDGAHRVNHTRAVGAAFGEIHDLTVKSSHDIGIHMNRILNHCLHTAIVAIVMAVSVRLLNNVDAALTINVHQPKSRLTGAISITATTKAHGFSFKLHPFQLVTCRQKLSLQ